VTPWTVGEPLFAVAFVVGCGLLPFLLLPLLTALFGEPLARPLRPAIGVIDDVALALEALARAFLVALLLAMLATVLLRYVFGISLTRLNEGALYAHGFAFLLAAPAACLRGAHVRVDILYSQFGERGRALVDLAGFYVFLAPLLLALLVVAGPAVEFAWRIGERSQETDGLPLVYLLKTAMLVFATALLAQGMAMAGRAALRLRGLAPIPVQAAGLPRGEGAA
jgi:TRAP-type mannitol/chloroaromatic compound transport system permease small subunit